ncbi:hypothetical protein OsJ_32253 [Oryza sativa Japonica Group]|uniref:BZIP domain-containing protein n=1 Tax=Oryza sativa subsp. japonica TaxID=39947 RepID=B9G6Q5_ORYSJ|nr:hypothetical protein OsJ_32253 [Oryza sativa Japonica Group]
MNTTSANELMMHRHVQAAPYAAAPQQQGGKQRAPGLPPTPPPPPAAASSHSSHGDVCMDDTARGGLLPPRKAHRRSRSDVPFGYFQPLPPPSPKMEAGGGWALPGCGGAGEVDLLNAYMSLEGMGGADGLNNSDGDSRGSSMRTNGADSSENESEDYVGADSQALLWAAPGAGKASGKKRRNNAAGEKAAPEREEPFHGQPHGEAQLRRQWVLANRQSAARSKERRMRYIAELEQKVQILQTEATTLSAQLTLLQRDSSGMATQNNELKFRLQSMEQQAQLRDALNEALTAEVQRLKLAANEVCDTSSSSNLAHQIQLRCQNQMLDLHKQQQQQVEQIPFYQLELPEQQNGTARNHESK